MSMKHVLGSFAVVMVLGAGNVTAQTAAVPAEFPPTSFTGNQYIDSNGCAFIRAGVSGATTWVPRVNRGRQQLCNFQPTFPPNAATAEIEPFDPSLIITITPPADAAPAPAAARPAASARTAEALTRPRVTNPGPPIRTVASIPARVSPPPAPFSLATVPVSPRVVTAPGPVSRPSLSLAQACAGKSGIQPGFVSARTGQPIDCGPSVQLASAQNDFPGVPRMTLAQICAESAATGTRFVNVVTGQRVFCDAPQTTMTALAPMASPAPAATFPSLPGLARAFLRFVSGCNGIPDMRTDGRYAVRCQGLSGTTAAIGAPVSDARVSTKTAPVVSRMGNVPASNARVSTRTLPIVPPAGYERVWKDGRINPHRGLPSQADVTSAILGGM